MAQTGTVTASELRFRNTPSDATSANVKRKLPRGTKVEVLEDQGDWLRVRVGGEEGFVSEAFIQLEQDSPDGGGQGDAGASIGADASAGGGGASGGGGAGASSSSSSSSSAPAGEQLQPGPDPAPGSCKLVGKKAMTPDGRQFATAFKLGVFNSGKTSIGDFVSAHPSFFPDVKPSRLRVMEAVSENEGKLEAINTWDNAFLTFGCFQWTVGTGGDAGELPPVLARLKQLNPAVFQKYFGQFGLDVAPFTPPANDVQRGFFTLDGTKLNTSALKARLRTLDWAYRFWLSGHDDTVRLAQIRHAMERVDIFFRNAAFGVNSRFIGDYISSEYGVALLLDQHVNRPGHVRRTVQQAVASLVSQLGADTPQSWKDEQEAKALKLYLQFRAETNMTDSDKRAARCLAAVQRGRCSDKRGSYEV